MEGMRQETGERGAEEEGVLVVGLAVLGDGTVKV